VTQLLPVVMKTWHRFRGLMRKAGVVNNHVVDIGNI
jgi:hypothetical protein